MSHVSTELDERRPPARESRSRIHTPGVTKRLIPIGTSLPGNCLKNYPGEGEEIPSLRGHKQSGPSGHPPGPFGVCNPNEKPKPPPLTTNMNIVFTHQANAGSRDTLILSSTLLAHLSVSNYAPSIAYIESGIN